jgi:hypothetical protein
MPDQPLSRRLRAIREADSADPGPAVEPEPEPQSLAAPRRAPLGRLLVDKGLLSETDLDLALERQREEARPLGQILLDMGAVTPQNLARALTEQTGFDFSASLRRRLAAEGGLEPEDGFVGEERFLVREPGSDEPLHVAASLLDAADAALELIEERDLERLEIVRARGGELEHVWSYERDEAAQGPGPAPDAAA